MFDLTNFRLRDMVECAAPLRDLGEHSGSLGEVAERTVHHLHDGFRDADGKRSCALVRFFKTSRYAHLDPELQAVAHHLLGGLPEDPTIPCLTLLGSAGDRPEWNDPARSAGHRVIPLPSEKMVERFPMISQLIKQLGLDVARVIRPDPRLMVDWNQTAYNVFHVPDARRSPHIPAQDFVADSGIRSVLGFGGGLPGGELFAVILFSKVPIPAHAAQLFVTVALSVKVAIVSVPDSPLFRTAHGC